MNAHEAEHLALAQARAAGCDCQPTVQLVGLGTVSQLRVEHDDDCALLREQGAHRAAVLVR